MIDAIEGEAVLFTAPVTVKEALYMQAKYDTTQKVGPNGSVLFEVIERVAQGKSELPVHTISLKK